MFIKGVIYYIGDKKYLLQGIEIFDKVCEIYLQRVEIFHKG